MYAFTWSYIVTFPVATRGICKPMSEQTMIPLSLSIIIYHHLSSFYPSILLSVCLSICLSVCLFIYLYISNFPNDSQTLRHILTSPPSPPFLSTAPKPPGAKSPGDTARTPSAAPRATARRRRQSPAPPASSGPQSWGDAGGWGNFGSWNGPIKKGWRMMKIKANHL